jgi:branched-chain amino acid transport system ATP-binding protein
MAAPAQSPGAIAGAATVPPVLELRSVSAGYGRSTILRDISLALPTGRVTAMIGPNGAGKTTLLRVAAGLLASSAGEVLMHGEDARRRRPVERAAKGLCLIPEGRGIFPRLTVRDNLIMHLPPWSTRPLEDALAQALEQFPVLKGRLKQTAGSLSGGQQQMLALCRCYLSNPQLILLDEVSMGLAPRVVDQIFDSLGQLAAEGIGILLVEQYIARAISICDNVVLLNRGRIVFDKKPDEVDQESIVRDYLGGSKA